MNDGGYNDGCDDDGDDGHGDISDLNLAVVVEELSRELEDVPSLGDLEEVAVQGFRDLATLNHNDDGGGDRGDLAAATDIDDLEKELAAALGFCFVGGAVRRLLTATTAGDEVVAQDEVAAQLDGGDGCRRVRRRTDTETCTQDVRMEDVRSSLAMSFDNFEIDYDDTPGPFYEGPCPSYDAPCPSDHAPGTSDHVPGSSDHASAETVDAPAPTETNDASAPAHVEEMDNQLGNTENLKLPKENTVKEGGRGDANSKKRKHKEIAPYGNYRHYYGYRLAHNIEEDPRFKLFNNDWFHDKDCLDIGCNNGLITINIAKKFHCRSLLGIDIDRDRIEDAKVHLKKEVAKELHLKKSMTKDVKGANDCEKAEITSVSEDQQKESLMDGSRVKRSLNDIISFRCENFVYSSLSVTKWVHLNWGDDGLLTFFAKIWRLLRPGGTFVVEPQPWKSYSSNRLVSETTSFNYKHTKVFPEDFQDILLDKIGFRIVEHVTPSVPSTVAGFNRPVLVFRK
ncbi:LOW QUALITY PROTEIN: hypothetical protein V2J09_017669 [Rumex salicifolius]